MRDIGPLRNSAEKNIPPLAHRIEELRQKVNLLDPRSLAENAGATLLEIAPGFVELRLSLLDETIIVSCPEFNMRLFNQERGVGIAQQALILYYFQTADGAPNTNRWISFADLPDGRFYNQAFQGYTGHELARRFQNDCQAFVQACEIAGGIPNPIGDAAFSFLLLPRVPLLALMWQGDEDFPSNFQLLFDASASHYLPTDACAIAGSMLTRQLIKSAKT
jgi:hypothetical protein